MKQVQFCTFVLVHVSANFMQSKKNIELAWDVFFSPLLNDKVITNIVCCMSAMSTL